MPLENLKREYFEKALERIDPDNLPPEHNLNKYQYVLVYEGKNYPHKYVALLAAQIAGGSISATREFGSRKSRRILQENGFKILDRKQITETTIVSEDDESTFPEGKEKYRLHRTRERDRNIIDKAKKIRWSKTGMLACDVCSFDFKKTYGSRGKGFIEAHHTVPIPKLDGRRKTKVLELALVCSNCHRMLHRGKKLLSVKQLRRIVNRNSPQYRTAKKTQ